MVKDRLSAEPAIAAVLAPSLKQLLRIAGLHVKWLQFLQGDGSQFGHEVIMDDSQIALKGLGANAHLRVIGKPFRKVLLGPGQLSVMHADGGAAMSAIADVRLALIGHLKDLHLPTVRECQEDTAWRAERETLRSGRFAALNDHCAQTRALQSRRSEARRNILRCRPDC